MFEAIEERWMNSMGNRNMRHTVNQVTKGARELQNLVLTINYEAIPWLQGFRHISNEATIYLFECKKVNLSPIKEWRGDVVCLQESKLDRCPQELWGSSFVHWVAL